MAATVVVFCIGKTYDRDNKRMTLLKIFLSMPSQTLSVHEILTFLYPCPFSSGRLVSAGAHDTVRTILGLVI